MSVKDFNQLAIKTIYKWNSPSYLVCLQTTEPNDHINIGPAPPQLQHVSEPTNNDIVHATFQNESDKLKIAHINIRSLLPSKNLIELFLDNSGIDVLVITETWLSRSVEPQATAIENYRCDLRQDRDGKKGGGIIIYHNLLQESFSNSAMTKILRAISENRQISVNRHSVIMTSPC